MLVKLKEFIYCGSNVRAECYQAWTNSHPVHSSISRKCNVTLFFAQNEGVTMLMQKWYSASIDIRPFKFSQTERQTDKIHKIHNCNRHKVVIELCLMNYNYPFSTITCNFKHILVTISSYLKVKFHQFVPGNSQSGYMYVSEKRFHNDKSSYILNKEIKLR